MKKLAVLFLLTLALTVGFYTWTEHAPKAHAADSSGCGQCDQPGTGPIGDSQCSSCHFPCWKIGPEQCAHCTDAGEGNICDTVLPGGAVSAKFSTHGYKVKSKLDPTIYVPLLHAARGKALTHPVPDLKSAEWRAFAATIPSCMERFKALKGSKTTP